MEGKMVTNVRYTNCLLNGQALSIAGSVGRFLWHFVQMLVAMMVGMGIFHVLTGKPSEAYLVLWYAGMELSMIPTMVALMLYQRHGWRHSAEMAAAMLIGPAVFLACAQLGWHNYIPGFTRNTLFGLANATMFLGMLGAMLYRREIYTRSHAAHQPTEQVDVHVHHGSV
jgi:flagellar biosynthetic protein FliP